MYPASSAGHSQQLYESQVNPVHAYTAEPAHRGAGHRCNMDRQRSDCSVVSNSSQCAMDTDSPQRVPSLGGAAAGVSPQGVYQQAADVASSSSRPGFSLPEEPLPPLWGHPRYRRIRELSSGPSGFVLLAEDMAVGEQVAIKFVERGSSHVSRVAEREILNHRLLIMHPSIVRFKEVFLTERHLCIAMEYMSGGDLAEMVDGYNYRNHHSRRPRQGCFEPGECVPEDLARWFFQQLMMAVEFTHRMGIANRDIKLENALIDNSSARLPLLKLCDFGYSKDEQAESLCKTICGTPEYIAPEVLIENRYHGAKSDIWSCGVLLYIMLTGAFPFCRPEDGPVGGLERMQRMFPRIVAASYEPPRHVSEACRHLLSCMLIPDPNKRMSVAGVMAHQWFRTNLPRGVDSINETLLAAPLEQRVAYCAQSEAHIIAVVRAAQAPMNSFMYANAQQEMEHIMYRAAAASGRPSWDSSWQSRRSSGQMSAGSTEGSPAAPTPPAVRRFSAASDVSDTSHSGALHAAPDLNRHPSAPASGIPAVPVNCGPRTTRSMEAPSPRAGRRRRLSGRG